ncbi:unnamed protein product [Lepeophtheirus salmonis]|uniref:(salmon louse) hypothetical protein n=1 Tax=Lepeophtheirus salmonis TaxID=72036 RepID=A0A7R8H1T8_LEPSM|nr:unnamed protein product [Lepeophtheirus salmonis]CAF2816134.1 unnamed protein product [Lepeophtheirus salmonis]
MRNIRNSTTIGESSEYREQLIPTHEEEVAVEQDYDPTNKKKTLFKFHGTRRKSQILSYLHRGSVTFETFVYDTNVGDISSLSTYFNPERWTVDDLNHKFAQTPDSDNAFASAVADGGNNCNPDLTSKFTELQKNASSSVLPRLLVCPDDSMSEKEKQTIQWVILQSTVKTMKNGHSENRTQAVITPESPDGVFLPWDGISSSKKCSPLGYSKYSSNVWRPSDTGILSPFLWGQKLLRFVA